MKIGVDVCYDSALKHGSVSSFSTFAPGNNKLQAQKLPYNSSFKSNVTRVKSLLAIDRAR